MSDQKPTFRDYQAVDDEVCIPVANRNGIECKFFFKPLQESILRQYRQIYSGPPGSRKGKPAQAFKYLYDTCFIRTEGLDLSEFLEAQNGNEPAYASEKAFWYDHPRARLSTDAAIDGYLGKERPEADDTKE